MVVYVDRTGQQFGNYHLVQLLRRGNFSEVYLGEHISHHTRVAIKVLTSQLPSDEVALLLTQVQVIAHLRHPHIMPILDFGIKDNTPFLIMNYAPKGNLRQQHPKGTRLPLSTVIYYVKQIADALQYVHNQKLIHRDIKPHNMLLGPNDEILLSDFSIAVESQNLDRILEDFEGTIPYTAPEQLQGMPCIAGDQYSLGIVVYEWLTGDWPFRGSFNEIVQQHLLAPPPSLCEKDSTIPAAVEQVVLKALAKEPGQRFAGIQKFARALERASTASA
jgi:serine/threonine protein kinase